MLNMIILQEIQVEMHRFWNTLTELNLAVASKGRDILDYGCKETASVRRASLDLSAILIKLRK